MKTDQKPNNITKSTYYSPKRSRSISLENINKPKNTYLVHINKRYTLNTLISKENEYSN